MKLKFAITATATALLSACGGGGDSSGADAIDKYVGTWKGICDTRGDIYDTADDKTTSVIDSVKFSKLTATTANVETTTTVYASSDMTCTGTPIGIIVKTGLDTNTLALNASGISSSFGQNIWTYSNNVILAAGQKVDQINYTESKFSSADKATLTGGRVKLNTTYYGAESLKLIAYFVNANTVVLKSKESSLKNPLSSHHPVHRPGLGRIYAEDSS
jgi:hypothetical protein